MKKLFILFLIAFNSTALLQAQINYFKIDTYLSSIVDSGFSGVVLIAHGDTVGLEKAYGWTDRENQLPNSLNTVFPVGSVSKQFTGAAILKLQEEGKLSTDDLISKYIGNVPEDKRTITIHHLLIHASGLEDWAARCDSTTSLKDFIDMIMSSTLEFTPGEKHLYSNSGYQLLAAIVEIVSEMNFEEYLRVKLLIPAGMYSTGTFIPRWQPEYVVTGYRDNKRWGSIYDKLFGRKRTGKAYCIDGSSGILSTIADLFLWEKMLQDSNSTVLSQTSKDKFFTPYIKESDEGTSFYAYGWAVFTTKRNTRLIAHNGGINDVFQADFRRFTDEKVTLIIVTNSMLLQYGAVQMGSKISKMIFE